MPEDPCAQIRSNLRENAAQQRECREVLSDFDIPASIRKATQARLNGLINTAQGIAAALARCEEEHNPDPGPTTPVASLRSEHVFDGAVSAVVVADLPTRRAVAVQQKVRFFDADTGEFVRDRVLPGVMAAPLVSPKSDYVAIVGGDGTLVVVDVEGEDRWRASHSGAINSVAVSPATGAYLATGTATPDKRVRVFTRSVGPDENPLDHQPVWSLAQDTAVTRVAISPDDQFVVAANRDRSVRLLAASGGGLVKDFGRVDEQVRHLAFNRDGTELALGIGDGTLRLINSPSSAAIARDVPHPSAVTFIDYSPDGELVATVTAAPDSTVRVWRVSTPEPTKLSTFDHAASAMFNPISGELAVARTEGRGIVVDPVSGTVKKELTESITTLAYGPDGKLIIAAVGNAAKVFNA